MQGYVVGSLIVTWRVQTIVCTRHADSDIYLKSDLLWTHGLKQVDPAGAQSARVSRIHTIDIHGGLRNDCRRIFPQPSQESGFGSYDRRGKRCTGDGRIITAWKTRDHID